MSCDTPRGEKEKGGREGGLGMGWDYLPMYKQSDLPPSVYHESHWFIEKLKT